MLTPFQRRVLEVARTSGAIGAGDFETVRVLAEQGIDPEQILVGGGVVTRHQYADWLSQVSGLPTADILPDTQTHLDGLTQELIERGVLPILVSKKAAEVAFTNPEPGLMDEVRTIALNTSKEFRPSVMLVAEFRRRIPWKETVVHPIRTLRRLFSEADKRGSHQIRLLPSHQSLHAFFDAGSDSPMTLPLRESPAIRLRLARMGSKSGWHLQTSRSGTEPVLFLVRRKGSGLHPLEWSQLPTADRKGLTLVIAPDAFTVHQFSGQMAEAFDGDDEDGQEQALHAALAGKPALAVASQDGDWYKPASLAGVDVRIVRGHRSGSGIAWETVA